MSKLAWLTVDDLPAGRTSRTITVPDDDAWLAILRGCLYLLTVEENYEQFGALTPAEMADEWRANFFDFLDNGGDPVFDELTAARLRLTATDEASLTSTGHAFQIGPTTGPNIIIDQDEIQARNNGAVATLALNPGGAGVVGTFVRFGQTTPVTLAGGNNAIVTGAVNSTNLALDTTALQARNNGAAAAFNLNPLGGAVNVGTVTAATLVVGIITEFGGAAAPTGWLLCDGAAVSRTTYAALFAVIGTGHGAGDGSTTFNVPNIIGSINHIIKF